MTEIRYEFPVGNQPRCRLEFKQNGVLANPTDVAITIDKPDDTTTALTLTDLTPVSTGLYDLFVLLDDEGDYLVKVKATAPFVCATPRIRITATP